MTMNLMTSICWHANPAGSQTSCSGKKILASRSHDPQACAADGCRCVEEATSIMHDSLAEDDILPEWPSWREYRKPLKSLALRNAPSKKPQQQQQQHSPAATGNPKEHAGTTQPPETYPERIDVYHSLTQATFCNAWRLVRIQPLLSILGMAQFLQPRVRDGGGRPSSPLSSPPSSPIPNPTHHLTALAHTATTNIRTHVASLCCSIPYLLAPHNPSAMLPHYPHAPGLRGSAPSAHPPPGPRVVACMSQMRLLVSAASRVEVVPPQGRGVGCRGI